MTGLTMADVDAAVATNTEDVEGNDKFYPPLVPDRVAHIDADFLAYMVSYERKGEKNTLEDILYRADIMAKDKRLEAGAGTAVLHLTPNTSDKGGRYDIAIQKPYQAQRTGQDKPRFLEDVRRHYAVKNTAEFHGIAHENAEADDGMSAAGWKVFNEGCSSKVVIITKDKDLRMVPCLHLNWDTGEIHDASEDSFGWIGIKEKVNTAGKVSKKHDGFGTKFFWFQLLMGDTADNIKGCPKAWIDGKHKACGLVGAYALLKDASSDRECLKICMEAYKSNKYFHWQSGEKVSWQDVFWSEAQMLWMQRTVGDINDVKKWVKEFLT